jgi:photosystem II stability/assembly factor-like uncharacterized protein
MLEDVSFSDANNVTGVGDFGTIVRTTNAGRTWISHTSRTNRVASPSFL